MLPAYRLLAAIYPTRTERLLSRIVTWAYRRGDAGVLGFVGDRADDLRAASCRFRAKWHCSRNTPIVRK